MLTMLMCRTVMSMVDPGVVYAPMPQLGPVVASQVAGAACCQLVWRVPPLPSMYMNVKVLRVGWGCGT